MHWFNTLYGKGQWNRNLEILRREKDKDMVAPGPFFTSFPNSALLRCSSRRWRKLLVVGVITLDLALGREWLSTGSSFPKVQRWLFTFRTVSWFSGKVWEETEAGIEKVLYSSMPSLLPSGSPGKELSSGMGAGTGRPLFQYWLSCGSEVV